MSSSPDYSSLYNRKKYSLDFKLMLIEEAKQSSNQKVGMRYGIAEKNVRGWRKNEEKIRQALAQGGTKYRLAGQLFVMPTKMAVINLSTFLDCIV